MDYTFNCPYLKKLNGSNISCELVKVTPPDRIARRHFLEEYCGSGDHYKECPFYKILDDYYHRLYSKGDAKW